MRPLGWLVIFSTVTSTAHGVAMPAKAKALDPRATLIPAPIVVPASQYWEGDDGPWSSFALRVGTPSQNVRVFISTAGTNTWVVLPQGCTSADSSNCGDLRGGQFIINSSTTWENNQIYNLALEENLNYTGNGQFGFDTVGLGWQGSGGPTLDHQVVAGIATKDFYLGVFGVTPRPTNFTTFNDPQASYLATLKNKSLVPSLSWGYTAGAQYRLKGVLGSLVLGGYDASRFTPTDHSFTFSEDQSRDLTVGIQSITMSPAGDATKTPLLPNGVLALIDSTVPDIWLPVEACQKFESAFGLTYNETTQLYFVDDKLHTALLGKNANVTFTLGNTVSGGPATDIVLPYMSFDRQFSNHPLGGNSRYFPLRRAVNSGQYTLGRTFLQEAYVVVDYERSNFIVAQTLFPESQNSIIIAIRSPGSDNNSTSSLTASTSSTPKSASLNKGAIIGIAVAAIVFLILLVLVIVFFRRRRAAILAEPPEESKPSEADTPIDLGDHHELPAPRRDGKSELDAMGNIHIGHEVDGMASSRAELDSPGLFVSSQGIHELANTTAGAAVYELDGDDAIRAELPARPVGVERRSSTAKDWSYYGQGARGDGDAMDTLAEELDPPPKWEEVEVPAGGMPQPVITLPEPGSRPGSRYQISVPDLREAAAKAEGNTEGEEQQKLAPREEQKRPGTAGSVVPSVMVTRPDGEEGTLSTDGFGTDSFRQAIQGMGIRVPLPAVLVSRPDGEDTDPVSGGESEVSPLGSPAPTAGRTVSPPSGSGGARR